MKATVLASLLCWLCSISACQHAASKSSNEMKFSISHYKFPCMGESVQLCYIITKEDGSTEYLYDEIIGFDYQWGYNYIINVEKVVNNKPPAGGSSFTYQFKNILKKVKAPEQLTFNLSLNLEGQSVVEKKEGKCTLLGEVNIDAGKYSCEEIARSASGVFRHNPATQSIFLLSLK